MPDTQFEFNTPLGPDVLRFHKLVGLEALGAISNFQIECFSEKTDIDLDALLGKIASVGIVLPGQSKRYLTGYITRFAHVGTSGSYQVYSATVQPWPWLLTRTTDCRIFQNKTVPDIVKEVFADHPGVAEFRDALSGSYHTREYCVQYRESDFDFICRLFEDEGIYFFFEFEKDKNVLVMADSYSAHSPAPGLASIEFVDNFRAQQEASDHISDWHFERVIQPGKTRLIDYDFKRPKVKLDANSSEPRGYSHSDYEVFDYPGNFEQQPDGTHYTRTRLDESQSQYELATAQTNARALGLGQTFKLTGHVRREQNREYLVTETRIFALAEGIEAQEKVAGSQYGCYFTALQSQQDFRPNRRTRKPHVQGPQTAVVVGPDGDEIYTDKYGRVKVQFFWDRLGKENENSSCWMRVSHPWAGKNWGFIAIPRIGQEVVVEFLEGDPDRPLITGSVYNGEQMPPHELPTHKTTTGVRSRSSTAGTPANFNEFRFEDQKGQEHIYLHAERNLNEVVESTHSTAVGANRISRVGGDKMVTIGHNETQLVRENRSSTVGINEDTAIGSNQSLCVGGNQAVTVGGSQHGTVGGSQSLSIGQNQVYNVGAKQNISVGASQTTLVGGSQKTMVGSKKVVLVGGSYSTMAAGTSSHMAASYKISTANFQLNVAMARKVVIMGTDDLKIAGKRTELIAADVSQTVGGERNIKVGGIEQVMIGGARTCKIGGADSMDVGGAIAMKAGAAISVSAGGVISITAAGMATITATAVTISAPVITITGNVIVAGTLTVAGALISTSIVSPLYTPGVGNLL